jgi:hypothetical protein
MLVVERGGDTMLPRIGIMRAQYPGGTARRDDRADERQAEGFRALSAARAEAFPLSGNRFFPRADNCLA